MSTFNFLSGRIRIIDKIPGQFQNGLNEFYQGPNHGDWPHKISRILMHESFHFWHVLSSGYLSNVIQDEWLRLLEYEQGEVIRDPTQLARQFKQRLTHPFAPVELFECWARYWDVHTYNPSRIVEYDGDQSQFGSIKESGYPGQVFDLAMVKGERHCEYSEPYRWTLELLNESTAIHNIAGNTAFPASIASYLLSLTFPCVTSCAFASPNPVGMYLQAFRNLANDETIIQEIMNHHEPRINLAWLDSWSFLCGELINPVLNELQLPTFTPGLDVVHRGALASHPLYSKYLQRHAMFRDFGFGQWSERLLKSKEGLSDLKYCYTLSELPRQDFWVLYSQPGQPSYRQQLGLYMQPPTIEFLDAVLHPEWPILNSTEEERIEQTEQWIAEAEQLDRRIDNFEVARYLAQHNAVLVG